MKKLLVCLIAALAVSLVATKATLAGAGTSKQLNAGVTVINAAPEIDIAILKFDGVEPNKNDPWQNGQEQTSTNLSFGDLVHTYLKDGVTKEAGVWYSKVAYLVNVYAQGFGKSYEIKSTCAGLGSLPADAFVIAPYYAKEDKYRFPDGTFGPQQGDRPSGSTLGTTGSAVGTDVLVYRSSAGDIGRIIQVWYGIPTKDRDGNVPYAGWKGIPLTQTPGTFTGSVTITIAPI